MKRQITNQSFKWKDLLNLKKRIKWIKFAIFLLGWIRFAEQGLTCSIKLISEALFYLETGWLKKIHRKIQDSVKKKK